MPNKKEEEENEDEPIVCTMCDIDDDTVSEHSCGSMMCTKCRATYINCPGCGK